MIINIVFWLVVFQTICFKTLSLYNLQIYWWFQKTLCVCVCVWFVSMYIAKDRLKQFQNILNKSITYKGLPYSSDGKESACNAGDLVLIPGSGTSSREGNGIISLNTPVFLPGEFHGQRSLAGYSPWGRKALDTTK